MPLAEFGLCRSVAQNVPAGEVGQALPAVQADGHMLKFPLPTIAALRGAPERSYVPEAGRTTHN